MTRRVVLGACNQQARHLDWTSAEVTGGSSRDMGETVGHLTRQTLSPKRDSRIVNQLQ